MFNKSIYYERFKRICQKLKFEPLKLKQPIDQAADVIMPDRGHLDNNPIPVTKPDVIKCLDEDCKSKSFGLIFRIIKILERFI